MNWKPQIENPPAHERCQPSTTDATSCVMCGGPFRAKRIIIDGKSYHDRCAIESWPPHTHRDCARLSDEIAAIRAKVDELTAALRITRDAVWSGGDTLKAIAVIDAALAVNSQDHRTP